MRGHLYLDPRHHHDGVHATLHIDPDGLDVDLHIVIPTAQAVELAAVLTALLSGGRATPS